MSYIPILSAFFGVVSVQCSSVRDAADDEDGTRAIDGGNDSAEVTAGTEDGRAEAATEGLREALADDAAEADATATEGPPTWTVLVYMAADNDLEPYSFEDLDEMAQVESKNRLSIVVQADFAVGFDDRPETWDDKDYKTTLRMQAGDGEVVTIADIGETNSSDPQTLADFVEWGLETYPAERTALVLWDHGEAVRGFALDWTSFHGYMSILELAGAAGAGIAGAAGPDRADGAEPDGTDADGTNEAGPRLDLVAFDACLMATYEVAVALAPHARCMVASEEWVDYQGWDYGALQHAADGEATDGVGLGLEIADGYAQSCEAMGSPEWTVSVVDLDSIAALKSAMQAAVQAAAASIETSLLSVLAARRASDQFDRDIFEEASSHMVDLGSFASAAGDAFLGPAVTGALEAAVVLWDSGSLHSGARGLSIYFPLLQEHYEREMYEASASDADWLAFLDLLLPMIQPGDAGPFFADEEAVVSAESGPSPVEVSATIAEGGAEKVMLAAGYFGYYDSYWDAMEVLSEIPVSIAPGSGTVTGSFDRRMALVSDGQDESLAFAVFLDDEGTALEIPFDYWDDGASEWTYVVWTVAIDPDSGELLTSKLEKIDDAGKATELAPRDGDLASPLLYEWAIEDSLYQWFSMDVELDPSAVEVTLVGPEDGDSHWFALAVWDEFETGDWCGKLQEK